ncbi:hypothetical protein EQG49_06535 [Periweissella cryptocerci]|uniref:Bacteriocin immunity protein n=1 Tax=Periweissella cryptocerci TaxID=2506420 RepID=A0A4P6YTP6_9LACO|nr:bacteriocin immunity protein [Periweissella cryptocerci]QBO36139.1 hypothetical protein EQG49_06535 [Periweissella cryptocerci]
MKNNINDQAKKLLSTIYKSLAGDNNEAKELIKETFAKLDNEKNEPHVLLLQFVKQINPLIFQKKFSLTDEGHAAFKELTILAHSSNNNGMMFGFTATL